MRAGSKKEVDPNLINFGLKLRNLRVGKGLTQEQLAHEAHLHRTVVGFIERGEREVGISTVWKLAEALGVPATELFS